MLTRRIVLIAVAAALVIIFLNFPNSLSTSWRSAGMQLLSPLVKIENGIVSSVTGMRASWRFRRDLAEENIELRKRVKEITRENLLLRGMEEDNRRLRRLLSFTETNGRDFIPAGVIGRDTRNWYSSVVLNRGIRDGVRAGMAVVNLDGVVGKVIEAGPSVCKVLLIVDRQSRVGGAVERTREMGIVKGTSFNTCLLTYLPRRSQTRRGDRVVTSGLGGVYPKGLYIGEVTGVYEGEFGLYRYADISPGANFATIEEVLIVVERREEKGGSSP